MYKKQQSKYFNW